MRGIEEDAVLVYEPPVHDERQQTMTPARVPGLFLDVNDGRANRTSLGPNPSPLTKTPRTKGSRAKGKQKEKTLQSSQVDEDCECELQNEVDDDELFRRLKDIIMNEEDLYLKILRYEVSFSSFKGGVDDLG